ncbi:MAG: nucleotidyltransferase family protein [Sphaerochaetaceae bacterium]|jgi:molybdenum cofactor cytidylyltransferase|nr:nucleotidyltransferase family protein [Sphaerochaetaceae bacterium]MDD3366427.1 nucleotidyltransferase family protein [Sphaerochaetaceae bacterium]MDD4219203.1 nucleotidyltransferase family protein [Sphaerochaetaceae bacterium]MDY0370983.1 nucleotidyltransferase family protein [Sphaerochaetaceae bacterium]
MVTVLLAAGKATRMKEAKLLLPFRGEAIIIHALRAALQSSSTVILVTGWYEDQIEAIIAPLLKQYGDALYLVHNNKPNQGQFSSTQIGVAQVTPNTPFFIALADAPLIKKEHYEALKPLLENYDGVRPFFHTTPGHPVLCAAALQQTILEAPLSTTMRELLEGKNIRRFDTDDPAWITDIDTPSSYQKLINAYDVLT